MFLYLYIIHNKGKTSKCQTVCDLPQVERLWMIFMYQTLPPLFQPYCHRTTITSYLNHCGHLFIDLLAFTPDSLQIFFTQQLFSDGSGQNRLPSLGLGRIKYHVFSGTEVSLTLLAANLGPPLAPRILSPALTCCPLHLGASNFLSNTSKAWNISDFPSASSVFHSQPENSSFLRGHLGLQDK